MIASYLKFSVPDFLAMVSPYNCFLLLLYASCNSIYNLVNLILIMDEKYIFFSNLRSLVDSLP